MTTKKLYLKVLFYHLTQRIVQAVSLDMTTYKKGDKVMLYPPGGSHPIHNLLYEKEATIVGKAQQTEDIEWYSVKLSSGSLIPAPANWLRKKTDETNDDNVKCNQTKRSF